MSHPLSYFDRAHIINLDSRTDRLREMEHELQRIGLSLEVPFVERFSAIRPQDRGEFETIGARGLFLSHLAILKRAAELQRRRIVIFEDDLNFNPDFTAQVPDAIRSLESQPWDIFYGGYQLIPERHFPLGMIFPNSDQEIRTTHFIGFSASVIPAIITFLETLLTRHDGDPRGGPMHVDGAYSWFRRHNPDCRTILAVPPLGYQRASRTDIHALRWFDRLPGLRQATAAARNWRNLRRSSGR